MLQAVTNVKGAAAHSTTDHESVKAIARRQDNDDVLFELTDGRVAVVHLTWSASPSSFPDFPWTTLYASIEEFAQKNMIPEHAEWDNQTTMKRSARRA
jgi:hypothetical protein